MNRFAAVSAACCGLLVLFASLCASAVPVPFGPGSDQKTDCSKKTSTGETSKDCDNISSERMSTRMKDKQASMSSNKSGSNSMSKTGSKSESKSESKTGGSKASSDKSDKSESKSESDKLSDERMSTRGLNPPKSDKDKQPKPDTKPDSSNPK